MSDYVASQKAMSVTYDSDIEVITSNLQKIQFTSSGQVQLSRPDKLRATRTGGYRDVENCVRWQDAYPEQQGCQDYAQIEAEGTADQLIDVLREKHGVVPPARLLLPNVFDVDDGRRVEGAVIGKGVIDGIECDHLAFRNTDTDWQIWTNPAPSRFPRKYVITSKGIAEAPQYTLRIKEMEDRGASGCLCVQAGSIRKEDCKWAILGHRRSAAGHHHWQEARNDPDIKNFLPFLG